MTNDFTHAPAGHLSETQLNTAPQLLYAWSHSAPQSQSVETALALESLVKRWIDEKCVCPQQVRDLTVADYNCLLEGWARSGAGPQGAERCEQILDAMERQGGLVQPDLESYRAVLLAWRRAVVTEGRGRGQVTPHAAVRAQRILERLVRLSTGSTSMTSLQAVPATTSSSSSSSTRNTKRQKNGRRVPSPRTDVRPELLPDADCFDMVLQTWSRCAGLVRHAPQKAEAVLALMERLYESQSTVAPPDVALTVKPRTTSFNAVLATWSRSKAPQATERAWDLLQFMELLEDDHVAPDNASYCTVMGALSRASHVHPVESAQQTEALLKRVEERYREQSQATISVEVDGDDHQKNKATPKSMIIPDTILYNTAMGCWAKTNQSGAYRKARSILDRQLRLSKDLKRNIPQVLAAGGTALREYQPDVFGYTSVIASCAAECGSPQERSKAFNVAFSTLKQMETSGIAPNHVTYGNMLKAVARLLPAGCASRQKWAKRFFAQACEAGCVGDMVLSRAREALPSESYKQLLQGHSKRQLPTEWTRNLPAGVSHNCHQERKHRQTRNLSVEQKEEQKKSHQFRNNKMDRKHHNNNNRQQQPTSKSFRPTMNENA